MTGGAGITAYLRFRPPKGRELAFLSGNLYACYAAATTLSKLLSSFPLTWHGLYPHFVKTLKARRHSVFVLRLSFRVGGRGTSSRTTPLRLIVIEVSPSKSTS